MLYSSLLIILIVFSIAAYFAGKTKALSLAKKHGGSRTLHSLPGHYGMLTMLGCALPAFMLYGIWKMAGDGFVARYIMNGLPAEFQTMSASQLTLVLNDIRNLVYGNISSSASPAIQLAAENYTNFLHQSENVVALVILLVFIGFGIFIYSKITPALRARNTVETIIRYLLLCCSAVAILTTIGIVLSVLFEAIRFFKIIPIQDFLFGLEWSPQMAIREGQFGSSGAFGAIPIFTGTLLIAGIAMAVAIPVGLLSAIYLSEFANTKFRTVAKPALEILAGIPTVVYGFFAALTVAPFIREGGSFLGLSVSSESALAAGLVMGVMIIPFVSSLSDDVIHAVPQTLRDGSYGLGATKYETIKHVVIPAALPGIVGGILLAVSRAIGETMIVVMAAGLSANLTANPFQAVTTVTVQIVTLLVGDQEFDSPKTLAAFALGLFLFIFTLCLNIIALRVVRKYREQYE